MKNYYYNINNGMYEINTNTDFPEVDHIRSGINIDYSYRIKEDGILKVKDYNNNITEYEVKKNDIIFLMYSNTEDYKNKQIIIIRDNKFDEYFKGLDEFNERREKEMTENKSCICNCNDCCEASM